MSDMNQENKELSSDNEGLNESLKKISSLLFGESRQNAALGLRLDEAQHQLEQCNQEKEEGKQELQNEMAVKISQVYNIHAHYSLSALSCRDKFLPYVSTSQLINAARHYAIISYPGHVTVIHLLTRYASAILLHVCLPS